MSTLHSASRDSDYFLPTDEVFDLTATTPNPISGPSGKMGDLKITDISKKSGNDSSSKKEVVLSPASSRMYPRRLPI